MPLLKMEITSVLLAILEVKKMTATKVNKGTEKVTEVGYKIEIIVEYNSFEWSIFFNKVVYLFRNIKYYNN